MNIVTNANILERAERRATISNARHGLKITGLRQELSTLNGNLVSTYLFAIAVVLASSAAVAVVFTL